MLEKSNAPPGGSPVGASSVLAEQKRTNNSMYSASRKAFSEPQGAGEQVIERRYEVHRRRYGSVEVAYSESPKRSRKRRSRDCASGPKPKPDAKRIKLMRIQQVLNVLVIVAANRREVGISSFRAFEGILVQAAELIWLSGEISGAQKSVQDLRRWAAARLPERWQSATDNAWAEASNALHDVPDAADIGERIDLRLEEWLALPPKKSALLLPLDATEEKIAGIRKTRRMEKQRADKKAERREAGARPHEESIAAFCRKHNLAESTYYLKKKNGPEVLAAWLAENDATNTLEENVASQYSKKERESDVSLQSLFLDRTTLPPAFSVSEPDALPAHNGGALPLARGSERVSTTCFRHQSEGGRA